MKYSLSLLGAAVILLLCGCESFNYTKHQSVPVSSIPAGAAILVDGQPGGTTPANLSLTCTQSHIISLCKDGYQQCDVIIKRVFSPENAMLNATNDGIRNGDFFKSANQGVTSGLTSFALAESRGDTYKLTPTAISVTLKPEQGQAVADYTAQNPDSCNTSANSQAEVNNGTVNAVSTGDDNENPRLGTVIREAGAVGSAFMPKVGKDWTVGKSSSSHESFSADGYTKTTTKTKTSVGFHADTGGMVQAGASVLGALADKLDRDK